MAKSLSDTLFTQHQVAQLAAIWRRVYHRRRSVEHVLSAPAVINPKTLAREDQRTIRVKLAGRKRRETSAAHGTHPRLSPPATVWPIHAYQRSEYLQVTLAGRTRREMVLRAPHSRLRAPGAVQGSTLPVFSSVASSTGSSAGAALSNPAPVLVRAPPWRFVVTTLQHVSLTFLDRIAINRSLLYTMNKAATATGVVDSSNPEVNIVHTDGDPFLSEGNRFLLGFRREGLNPKWVIRYAGIILQLEDAVDGDVPKTTFTAYDPWEYLLRRPCRNADGSLPGDAGMTFTADAWRGDQIAKVLIDRTIQYDGTVHVDTGGPYFGGSLHATAQQDIVFAQGCTVGDALTQLTESGLLDIWFSPIYDPFNRPGILCELNIYNMMGNIIRGGVISWDKPGRNLTGISRLEDGSQRANVIQYFRTNSLPVGAVSDSASYAKYGKYWDTSTFQSEYPASAIEALAEETLLVKKDRPSTINVTPAPEIAPVPFVEYFLGSQLPIGASKRLREPLFQLARVYSIPINLDDDSVEKVTGLEFSSDALTPITGNVPPTPPPTGFTPVITGGTEPGDTLSVIIYPA